MRHYDVYSGYTIQLNGLLDIQQWQQNYNNKFFNIQCTVFTFLCGW